MMSISQAAARESVQFQSQGPSNVSSMRQNVQQASSVVADNTQKAQQVENLSKYSMKDLQAASEGLEKHRKDEEKGLTYKEGRPPGPLAQDQLSSGDRLTGTNPYSAKSYMGAGLAASIGALMS